MAVRSKCGHSNQLIEINYYLFAASAIAINCSAGITQPEADVASGAGTLGTSIVAGAGLPAKAEVAAIANAVARTIFFNFIKSCLAKSACFLRISSDARPAGFPYVKLMSVCNHFV